MKYFEKKQFELLNKFIIRINFCSVVSGPMLSRLYGSYRDAVKSWKGYYFEILPGYDAYIIRKARWSDNNEQS